MHDRECATGMAMKPVQDLDVKHVLVIDDNSENLEKVPLQGFHVSRECMCRDLDVQFWCMHSRTARVTFIS